MPLTPLQKGVAHILAKHRSPESHVAGGAVINRGEDSYRISNDLDIFHDRASTVGASAEADAHILQAEGYSIQWTLQMEGIHKAIVTRDENQLRLDWTSDSAFRFFPPEPDQDFGYCLHPVDLATNKVLALAGRTEIRDFLDILLLNRDCLSLGAIVWGACGKDAGFTPSLLLDQINRHTRYQQSDLLSEHLVRSLELRDLKQEWLSAHSEAERLCEQLPPEELGCIYLDAHTNPVTPDPDSPEFPNLARHWGSPGGSWPKAG